jgi:predicted nuclease of restriction endonuclease-like (RecB) superfamily
MKLSDSEYKLWLIALKQKIRSVQVKAALAVNAEMIRFYRELGKMIAEKEVVWGSKFLNNLSVDLKQEFPNLNGFSVSNLKYCKRFYLFYQPAIGQQAVDQLAVDALSQQAVDQIPWGHNILIFTKSASTEEALFYVQQTIKNNWSRDELGFQIKSGLFKRQGNSVSNFKKHLARVVFRFGSSNVKDPYIFDFLELHQGYKERDIENQLVAHIRKFLLELGKGLLL